MTEMSASVTMHIAAPPERVYELISDVTRMGEWSPECVRCEWIDGATGPVAGARFKGWNKRGVVRWSTTPKVRVADPGREFTFVAMAGKREATLWSYRIEPSDGGSDVTESYETIHIPVAIQLFEKVFWRNRAGDLEDGMRSTLERIKAAAEQHDNA